MKKFVLSLATWAADALPESWINQLYKFKPLANLIRAVLNIAAPAGITQVEIAGGVLQGWRMALDLQREKDYWLGTYEPELQGAIRDFVRSGMVAYDIGANIGYISLSLAKAVGHEGKVIAFEALVPNYVRLAKNITLNAMEARINVHALAVADTTGTKRFIGGPSWGTGKLEGSAGRASMPVSDYLDIECVSLDDFVFKDGNIKPDVVKMDIEGGEVLALPGMRRLLRDHCPFLLIEIHGPQAAEVVWKELTGSGYTIQHIREGYPKVQSWEELPWKSYIIGHFTGDDINAE